MKVNFTKKQFETLIKVVDTGSSIYGILGDTYPEEYAEQNYAADEIRDYLLTFASDFGLDQMIQKFDGALLISEDLSDSLQEVIEDYDEETFWHELETRLGKRDFERSMTRIEREEIEENGGWYPERIHDLYEKWGQEFEDHGVDRLEVKER